MEVNVIHLQEVKDLCLKVSELNFLRWMHQNFMKLAYNETTLDNWWLYRISFSFYWIDFKICIQSTLICMKMTCIEMTLY